MMTGDTTEMVEAGMAAGGRHRAEYLNSLSGLPFTLRSRWRGR
ncbi:hypothetical protein ACIRF8_03280 [Streptomyces sp. NPDC102406]